MALDGILLYRRLYRSTPLGPPQRSWLLADVELAPGLAVVAQHWGVGLSAFARMAKELACAELDCQGAGIRLLGDFGLSLDADGRNLGVPVGLLVHGRMSWEGTDLGAGVFWLGRDLRIGVEWRTTMREESLATSWPEAEWNLRVDWLPPERD